jgi:hypothetical protein
MVIGKNKTQKLKLKAEPLWELATGERKFRDLVAFGRKEPAAVKALELLILGGQCLTRFYGGRPVSNLKGLAQVLLSIKAPEGHEYLREIIEIETLKRKTELGNRVFNAEECEKILAFFEKFFIWLGKMIPEFSGGFEF